MCIRDSLWPVFSTNLLCTGFFFRHLFGETSPNFGNYPQEWLARFDGRPVECSRPASRVKPIGDQLVQWSILMSLYCIGVFNGRQPAVRASNWRRYLAYLCLIIHVTSKFICQLTKRLQLLRDFRWPYDPRSLLFTFLIRLCCIVNFLLNRRGSHLVSITCSCYNKW